MRYLPPASLWFVFSASLGLSTGEVHAENFRHYILTSKDFSPVERAERKVVDERWNQWVLLPRHHRWVRPYTEALVAEMTRAGFNGGVCDFLPRNDADLQDKHGLLWILDHAAGKGDLRLPDNLNTPACRMALRRPRCLLDPELLDRLQGRLGRSIRLCLKYPTRIAYALDDEISWSTLTNPCRWDNHPLSIRGFHEWLRMRYGGRGAILRQWGRDNVRFLHRMATPDDLQHLYRKPVPMWNLSPWCDALSYMDSQLLNLTGDLVSYAHGIDPTTPCGVDGAQAPAPYGGYNYAKLMRKVQVLEVPNAGAAMEIARSLNTKPNLPLLASGVSDPQGPDGFWWPWYGLAHGFRGNIVVADGWFGPGDDAMRFGPEVRKLAEASRKLIGARWLHDGIAIYYSHPSIQVSWFLDCHVHGRSWIKRLSSMNSRLASTNAAFWAWTRLLEDACLQYNFVSYVDVADRGLNPNEYKVLILPRVLALSDAEAEKITKYVKRGGVAIADHMVGLFDQHGRGRPEPALDRLLGMKEHPPVRAGNVFGSGALTEFDGEGYWNSKFLSAARDIWPQCLRARHLPVAERQIGQFIAGRHQQGWAMLMNVSLAEYCLHRMRRSPEAAEIRKVVTGILGRAGVKPWLSLSVNGQPAEATEATYWERDGRRYVCVVKNPLRLGRAGGTKGSSGFSPSGTEGGVKEGVVRLTVTMNRPCRNVFDEIAQKSLGDGLKFEVNWKTDEAAIISMVADRPPTTTSPSAASRKEK